jgi:phage tail tube protein FII
VVVGGRVANVQVDGGLEGLELDEVLGCPRSGTPDQRGARRDEEQQRAGH